MKSKSIIHFAVGLILSAIVNVITLPIMAWLYPKEIIGKLAMLNVAVAFSVTLFTLGLDQAFVREYHESKNKIKVFFEAILPGFILLFATILTVNFLDENFGERGFCSSLTLKHYQFHVKKLSFSIINFNSI